tara:strand:+ start:343 stop:549 length:207 start_codon:yes stop_codon:yes gene_type:complete
MSELICGYSIEELTKNECVEIRLYAKEIIILKEEMSEMTIEDWKIYGKKRIQRLTEMKNYIQISMGDF